MSGKTPARAAMLPIPKDGKYRLYTVHNGIFTRGSLLLAGNLRVNLADYNAMLEPDKKYEVKISAKADNNGMTFIDRVFILNK